jgi:hypothetical protein
MQMYRPSFCTDSPTAPSISVMPRLGLGIHEFQ